MSDDPTKDQPTNGEDPKSDPNKQEDPQGEDKIKVLEKQLEEIKATQGATTKNYQATKDELDRYKKAFAELSGQEPDKQTDPLEVLKSQVKTLETTIAQKEAKEAAMQAIDLLTDADGGEYSPEEKKAMLNLVDFTKPDVQQIGDQLNKIKSTIDTVKGTKSKVVKEGNHERTATNANSILESMGIYKKK